MLQQHTRPATLAKLGEIGSNRPQLNTATATLIRKHKEVLNLMMRMPLDTYGLTWAQFIKGLRAVLAAHALSSAMTHGFHPVAATPTFPFQRFWCRLVNAASARVLAAAMKDLFHLQNQKPRFLSKNKRYGSAPVEAQTK